jgi:hypothetical protein
VEPLFTVRLGIPPHHLAYMSVLQIADHLDYWNAMQEGG